ncbi:hypothetical protein CVT24_005329 [Panaeolus cyanescens]|uniref:Uncharacterized protein n=1 Tax=Panaeolus cyanescens TaxID=181874 RepID=A0A409Y987_9AGAR|nr:hypothetical protein CVT24_005329 [Panaeolus cyanescens]
MKLPTSSSILLASLALSSSSSALAAPTAPAEPSETSVSSSSANHSTVSFNNVNLEERLNVISERGMFQGRSTPLEKKKTLLAPIPILGAPLINTLNAIVASVQNGNGQIDPHDLDALKSAINEVTRILNQQGQQGGSPSGDVGAAQAPAPSTTSAPDDSNNPNPTDTSNAGSSSATDSATSSADTAAPSGTGNPPTPPSSPPMPDNPPNTPAMPSGQPDNH